MGLRRLYFVDAWLMLISVLHSGATVMLPWHLDCLESITRLTSPFST